MPPLTCSGEQTGEISTTAAADTGLALGTPVIAGGADTQCGLLGMGATRHREMGILAGWSGPLQFVTDTPARMPNAEHGAEGT